MTKTSHAWPRWLALALTLIAVLLLAQLISKSYLQNIKVSKVAVNNQTKPSTPTPSQSAVQFDFYTVLPKMAVSEPTPPPAEAPLTAKPKLTTNIVLPAPAPSSPAPAQSYILQIAALRQLDDAEHLRDQMHSAGYPAFVQQYQTGQTMWYRVMVGPFASQDLAAQTQAQLKQRQITGLILNVSPHG